MDVILYLPSVFPLHFAVFCIASGCVWYLKPQISCGYVSHCAIWDHCVKQVLFL